jgi:hypothetical protein
MTINATHENHGEHVAGIVLSVLVDRAPSEMTLREAIVACERDVSLPSDEQEIRKALKELVEDELLYEKDGRFSATQAAICANRLSF